MEEELFQEKTIPKLIDLQAYMARYLAKNVVGSGIAKKCLIQLSYAIGVIEPISIFLKIDEESNIDQNKIIQVIKENFDLSPAGIKKFLNLDKPIYQRRTLTVTLVEPLTKKKDYFLGNLWKVLIFLKSSNV